MTATNPPKPPKPPYDYTPRELQLMWLHETGATPEEIEEAMNEADGEDGDD